ncbi:MAG: MATE family efflux transporter, partial [Nodosilinea sp.]
QATGEDDSQAVLLAGLRSGLIALAIGLAIVLLQYPLQQVGFAILSGSQEVESSGLEYFYGRIWGAPAVLINFVLIGWFLGREMNQVVLLLALIGNGANVLLDYLMIFQWGWASAGAGWATAVSQYMAMIIGLGVAALTITQQDFWQALPQLKNGPALREAVALKGNLLVRFLVLISTYAIFTNLSSHLGTITLAQNGLLLQIALLSQFTIQGVGLTTQTLSGNFKARGEVGLMLPLLLVSLATTLPIALGFAGITVLFPQTVFGLLTSHGEVSSQITDYSFWLVPLLQLTAVAFMLEGYFVGIKEGAILRNMVLIAFSLGFLPLALAAIYLNSNHLLWLSLLGYMATLAVGLAFFIPRSLKTLMPAVRLPASESLEHS